MVTNRMRRAIVLAIALVMMQGCSPKKSSEPFVFMLSDFMNAKVLPYDSPPQIIYWIDDHRFVTLEHYRDCNHGETFYNDTRAGIRKQLGRGDVENYQGRLINADPTGRNLAFPASAPPHLAHNDRGWAVELIYSTDGGKTFDLMEYMDHSSDPFEDSKGYAVFVTKSHLYVAKKWGDDDAYVVEYPMVSGIDLSKPYPTGITGDSFSTSKRPGVFSKLRTPSGQDRLTCDPSIKPTNPDAPLVP
ncbi:hypothetical protein LMG22037_04899 [Paraburkholderia phenoliruptrix]|uniref:Tli3-like domain-containing protein n=1 Tax=Paraburkholderia phenoliruptrix TaxID=252970 RepID=A0A6J5C253_9BURK|nr:hypothetical protein [Paraburkholderia phenoliruptrix]CAB3722544.1 hypothetical protein LMG22037_04899 [Paraburkholderia phenoliruptrix]